MRTPRWLGRTVTTVAVVLVAGGCESAPEPDPTIPPTEVASAAIDGCLVGTWIEESNESGLDLSGVGGGTALVTGAGRTLTFRAGGTELVEYGDGVTYSGLSTEGVLVERTISGSVEYRVTTADGVLTFELLSDDRSIEYRSGGRVVATGTFGQSDPVTYTCAGDTHTQAQEGGYHAEYSRG